MQGYSILKAVFDKIIDTGLTKQVYHSVIKITEDNGNTYPAYPSGDDEYSYLGIDDTKVMTVYCRQVDDLRAVKETKVSSSLTIYRTAIPHRVVFFQDYERKNQDDLIAKFLQFVFLPNVKLLKVITDKEKLANLESTAKDFNFGNLTFYAAIDFDIYLDLDANNCEIEISCNQLNNPYTKN